MRMIGTVGLGGTVGMVIAFGVVGFGSWVEVAMWTDGVVGMLEGYKRWGRVEAERQGSK